MQTNTRGELQNYCQRVGLPRPEYTTNKVDGPDHQPIFETRVDIKDRMSYVGYQQSTKKEAEKSAASVALTKLKSTRQPISPFRYYNEQHELKTDGIVLGVYDKLPPDKYASPVKNEPITTSSTIVIVDAVEMPEFKVLALPSDTKMIVLFGSSVDASRFADELPNKYEVRKVTTPDNLTHTMMAAWVGASMCMDDFTHYLIIASRKTAKKLAAIIDIGITGYCEKKFRITYVDM